MTKQEMFQLLLEQFLILNENKDRLIAAATSGDEAAQVLGAWRQANLNQMEMGNKIMVENTAEVNSITSELVTVQKDLKTSLEELQHTAEILEKITQVIGLINKAVSLGSQLVAIA